ncbi:MAG: SpoIVB peptidase [Eubacterium sp.]|nr:SpoIVB peptidase [Eubacterium sp.]
MKRKNKIGLYLVLGLLLIGLISAILYKKDHLSGSIAVNSGIQEEAVYPIGLPAGIYLKTKGVMVIDTVTVENQQGELMNPAKGKINAGDYITKFNDIIVGNKAQLQYLIKNNGNKKIILSVVSKKSQKKVPLTPVKNKAGEYQLGLWIRDDMQSIGTISFVTEENEFFSLGHGICDVDTGKLLSSEEGVMYHANIWGIKKGEAGNPGGLCGSIDYDESEKIGKISHNTTNGIWGILNPKDAQAFKEEKVKIAYGEKVQCGEAKIKLILQGKASYYTIEIIHVDGKRKEKNMIIKITDKNLLKKTNGIVQGMSGCPILQNNRLIGIVTHVMVNHPDYGYGILIDKISH